MPTSIHDPVLPAFMCRKENSRVSKKAGTPQRVDRVVLFDIYDGLDHAVFLCCNEPEPEHGKSVAWTLFF